MLLSRAVNCACEFGEAALRVVRGSRWRKTSWAGGLKNPTLSPSTGLFASNDGPPTWDAFYQPLGQTALIPAIAYEEREQGRMGELLASVCFPD
jgi:hypothetical protein